MRAVICMMTALALVVAGGAAAQQEPPVGPDVKAALAKIQAGDPASGRGELERLGRAGRLDAEQALGEVLLFGRGLAADPKSACAHFERSSAQWATGMHDLALCAEHGLATGVPDLAKAAVLYQRAADMGMAKSKCALGNLLIAGKGVAQDAKRGVALCIEAAQAGVADAQADVGNLYLAGQAVPQDYVEARRWYQLAADQRQHQAARTLGEMCAKGDGGPQSWADAKRFWRIAAEAGDDYAPHLLASRMTTELLAANFRPGDAARAAQIDEAIKWSELSVERDPEPKEVEIDKFGLTILKGLKEGDGKLAPHT